MIRMIKSSYLLFYHSNILSIFLKPIPSTEPVLFGSASRLRPTAKFSGRWSQVDFGVMRKYRFDFIPGPHSCSAANIDLLCVCVCARSTSLSLQSSVWVDLQIGSTCLWVCISYVLCTSACQSYSVIPIQINFFDIFSRLFIYLPGSTLLPCSKKPLQRECNRAASTELKSTDLKSTDLKSTDLTLKAFNLTDLRLTQQEEFAS